MHLHGVDGWQLRANARILEAVDGLAQVQNHSDLDILSGALIDLLGCLGSPEKDDALLREAGVSLDRALFPLLVTLGARGALCVADLADLVGRDHTTISRQLAKLETMGLILRPRTRGDSRRRDADLTDAGREIVTAITAARLRLLAQALASWPEADIAALARLNRRFADGLMPRLPERW